MGIYCDPKAVPGPDFPLVYGRFVALKIGKKCKVKAISVFVNYDK